MEQELGGVIDVSSLASNLELAEVGIWFSRTKSELSYPEEGNSLCYEIEEHSYWFQHRNRCIVEAVRHFPPPGPVFDVGGGNGFVSLALKQAGFSPVLVEPGVEGARNARKRGLEPVICATLEDAGFAKNSLPAVGLFDVLEHVKDDEGFLRTVRDLSKAPDGRLYVTVPAYQSLWSNEDRLAGHYRRYSAARLVGLLERLGFTTAFFTHIFAPLPLPIFLIRTIPSRLGIRRSLDFAQARGELSAPPSPLSRALSAALKVELRALRRGTRIPFGGSCLVVATVR